MDFDDFGKKRKPSYVKAKFWVRCLDCRAIYSDRVYQKYATCAFCDGANWSSDNQTKKLRFVYPTPYGVSVLGLLGILYIYIVFYNNNNNNSY